MKYSIGYSLWFVPSRPGKSPRELVITEVGTKWLTCGEDGRIDKKTLQPESLAGTCYPSREAWEQRKELVNAWQELGFLIGCDMPIDMTMEKIQRAKEVLGLAGYKLASE